MADQINLRDVGAPPTYFQPFKRNDFRLDEGYSEETRSQAGSELPAESKQEQGMEVEGEAATQLLPDWVGNLNEEQRSGMFCIANTVGRCPKSAVYRCPGEDHDHEHARICFLGWKCAQGMVLVCYTRLHTKDSRRM